MNSIANILGATIWQSNGSPFLFDVVLIDSRKLRFTKQAVFIAMKGARQDSHAYLKAVYDAGVRNFIVEENAWKTTNKSHFIDSNIWVVESGLAALQSIAAIHRHQFNYPLLAITGSNAKTIVKEWLAQLLKAHFVVVKNPKSYNSQVGVPLSVLHMQAQHNFAIFEAGISEPNEMQKLANILHPNFGVFTLLGEAHSEGFSSDLHKLSEKNLLFQSCEKVLFGSDQSLVKDFFYGLNQNLQQQNLPKKYWDWSNQNPQADFYIEVTSQANQTVLRCQGIDVSIPFTDAAAIWNASTCLAFLAMQGLDLPSFAPHFADLPVLDMRLQLKEAQQNCLLINDSYSADLGSLRIALEFLDEHAGNLPKTVILSDFLESGMTQEKLYATIAQLTQAHQVETFIGIGSAISKQAHLFQHKQVFFFQSTQAFLKAFSLTYFHQQAILLKGARSFAFERIGKLLEKQAHQTVFEINLNALLHNLNVYRQLLQPKVKLMAMVKAFSYGAGSYEIARLLHANRVDYLTVAYADEGVVLRKAGIETPIMVMNPEPQSFDLLIQYNLEPEMYHFEILEAFIQSLNGEEASIHLELDSGMKRLGFDTSEIPALIQCLKANPNLQIKSIFSHLAASEDPQHDAFTQSQIDLFKHNSDQIIAHFSYPILRHCLNSGGIARFPNAQFDMVRLGIGLYGVNPAPNNLALQAIGTLKTLISQVREISQKESIGYGRKGHLPQGGKIAIVAIGYADGLDRKLSNGVGSMLVNGKLAPIVGNICMDMTMLDVSNIDCKAGDEVIVFGENPSIESLSEQIGTIPYEILTGVSQRVKRVYFYA